MKLHTRRVYSICYRFTNSDSEAQDLTQDVFLRVFKNLKSFRAGEGLFIVWLTRLTRNLLIDHYRRTRMDRATESIEDQTPALEENTATMSRTEGMLAGREASEMLQAGLQKLSPELRETVILRDLEELEYREIAQVLNVPEGTVKSRLNRGRAELARVLRRQKIQYMTCAEFEILLCDYVDGTLHGEARTALESHLSGCGNAPNWLRTSRA